MSKKTFEKLKLITAADIEDVFNGFKSDKERINYMSQKYKKMSIAKAFSIFYNLEVSNELKQNRTINTVTLIEVGGIYTGTVKSFNDNGTITFEIPGVKEEIISKDNFTSCRDAVEKYLLNHDNKLMFEVRELNRGKYYVSILNAYYKAWQDAIYKIIQVEDGIQVHIDELVRGGYVCHTSIWPLCELTGKDYTSSVFIPGSHIVLNIENDFEKWIGEDVIIVPQKFGEYRDMRTGIVQNSLVGSRKKVLQIQGMQNMYAIYSYMESRKKLAELATNDVIVTSDVFDGTVTGIINSNKKTGVFIELDGKYITGLLPIDASDLLNYRPGNNIKVRIKEFEIQEGKEPFTFNKKKRIIKTNVRPVFEIA